MITKSMITWPLNLHNTLTALHQDHAHRREPKLPLRSSERLQGFDDLIHTPPHYWKIDDSESMRDWICWRTGLPKTSLWTIFDLSRLLFLGTTLHLKDTSCFRTLHCIAALLHWRMTSFSTSVDPERLSRIASYMSTWYQIHSENDEF